MLLRYATATAVAATTVAIANTCVSIRVRYAPRRNGRRTELADKIVVLCRLRRRQSKRLILSLKRRDLVLTQIIEDSACARFLRLDDVAGVVVHRVEHGAVVRRHVVTDLSLSLAVLAAALSDLRLNSVLSLERYNIRRIEAALNRSAETIYHLCSVVLLITDCAVEISEAKVYSIICVLYFALDLLKVHVHAEIAACKRSLSSRAATETAAEAITAPATESKEEEYDYPPCAVSTPAAVVIATIAGSCCDISKRISFCCHIVFCFS